MLLAQNKEGFRSAKDYDQDLDTLEELVHCNAIRVPDGPIYIGDEDSGIEDVDSPLMISNDTDVLQNMDDEGIVVDLTDEPHASYITVHEDSCSEDVGYQATIANETGDLQNLDVQVMDEAGVHKLQMI